MEELMAGMNQMSASLEGLQKQNMELEARLRAAEAPRPAATTADSLLPGPEMRLIGKPDHFEHMP